MEFGARLGCVEMIFLLCFSLENETWEKKRTKDVVGEIEFLTRT